MYHESDPLHGSVVPGSLPNTQKAFKGYRPLSITQRQPQDETMSAISLGSLLATSTSSLSSSSSSSSSSLSSSSLSATSAQLTELPSQSATSKLHVFELLNEDVKLPAMETLHWCKVFEFQEFSQKQHLVKVSYFLFKTSYLTHLTFCFGRHPAHEWEGKGKGLVSSLPLSLSLSPYITLSLALLFGRTKFDFVFNWEANKSCPFTCILFTIQSLSFLFIFRFFYFPFESLP